MKTGGGKKAAQTGPSERERGGDAAHPYRGRGVVLATKHAKHRQLARPFAAIGMSLTVPEGLDTDVLGTFTGEIERPGPPREVVVRKARLATAAAGIPLGLASEASFGPHPEVMFVPVGQELLAFVDEDLGIEIVESVLTLETNHASVKVAHLDELGEFLQQVGFPENAVVVRPTSHWDPDTSRKGLRDPVELSAAIVRAAAASDDGTALVETDMRAHMNTTRQRVIRRLGFRLARRLTNRCPACGTPGFGPVDVVRGLRCEVCGLPTALVARVVIGCAHCAHREDRPRSDLAVTPASQCPYCNP